MAENAGGRPARRPAEMTDPEPLPGGPSALPDTLALVHATFDSAPGGLAVVGGDGRLLALNQAFVLLWGFPPDMLARRDTEEMRDFAARQMADPQAFLDRLRQAPAAAAPDVADEFEHLDGRILERRSSALQVPGTPGAVVARWRDVTALRRAERAENAARARLAAIFEHAGEAILLADDLGRYLDANPAACSLLGRPRDTLLGLGVADVLATSPDDAHTQWQAFLAAGRVNGEVELQRPDGTRRVARFSAVAGIQPGVHLSILSDVTDTVQARQRERELVTQVELAAASASLVFWIVDLRDPSMRLSDPTWPQRLLGYSPEAIADHPDALDEFVHPEDRGPREAAWRAHVLGLTPTFECEFRIRHRDGHWLWLLARGRAVERDAAGHALRLTGVRIDITRRKLAELALEQQAFTDGLTGALTRRRFLELAEVEWSRAQRHQQPLALLMIDLDHFKSVNDRWGHAGGDAVLRAFAATAREVLRGSDLLGRVGGEEFAVLLPQTAHDGAVALAHRLRDLVRQRPVVLPAGAAAYTVSIGVVTSGPVATAAGTIERLMHAADDALYRAKGMGRDRVLLADVPG